MSTRHGLLVALLLALSLPHGMARAAAPFDLRRASMTPGDAQAGAGKVAVCGACHGADGNAIVPLFPVLAGQRAEYLYQALRDFQRRHDPASPMTAQAQALSEIDMRDIAAYFASVPRHPLAPASVDAGLAAHGAQLYREGDPTLGIPPCQGCHGVAAGGHPLAAEAAFYRLFPVLAGQHVDYIQARLAAFRAGNGGDTSNTRIMQGVAHNLDPDSASAIAAWLVHAGD